MNIQWLTFLVVALAAVELPKVEAWVQSAITQCAACPDQFKGKLVCAFLNGCHLELEFCAMMVFNCGRQMHHKHCEVSAYILIEYLSLTWAPFSDPGEKRGQVRSSSGIQMRVHGFLRSGGYNPHLLIDAMITFLSA